MTLEARLGAPAIKQRSVWLDERGDLYLTVYNSKETQLFRVDSKSLSRASRKWRLIINEKLERMRATGFIRAHTTFDLFAEGDPGYHYLLFRIMHYNFGELPDTLTETELFELLTITDEYNIWPSLLRPWIAAWIEPHQAWPGPGPYDYSSDFVRRLHNRLWVAWKLGEIEMFRKLVEILIKEVAPGKGTELLISGKPLPKSSEIPGLADFLEKERKQRVSDLLGVFQEELRHCQNGERRFCTLIGCSDLERSMCDFIVMGSIIRDYHKHVLDPAGHRGKEKVQSVNATYDRLKSIEIHNYSIIPGDGIAATSAPGLTHNGCNPTPWIHDKLDAIMFRSTWSLDAGLQKSLEYVSQLTGLGRPRVKGTKRELTDDDETAKPA
ncbi:uncharacterized protein PG986_010151 [Apiospora aurea]|uniref:Uncharacterized protein n=1 Tax=Apiospora aurea TaxID=335848 RepID=A0ABR1Q9R4_9PEZI